MEIAENITWTEELERLDVLLSQGQFELLLPGERYGGGEKEIWLVYLMNDAAESFLVFHDAELTGTYQKEYEGEIDAALEKDGEFLDGLEYFAYGLQVFVFTRVLTLQFCH